jgi:hypothetical protein
LWKYKDRCWHSLLCYHYCRSQLLLVFWNVKIMLLLLESIYCQFKVMLFLLGRQFCYSVCFSSIYYQLVCDSRKMQYNNIQSKMATMLLIHLKNTVEGSDKVSWLWNINQTNAVFNPLNDQIKSVFKYSLISLLKALLYALQFKFW